MSVETVLRQQQAARQILDAEIALLEQLPATLPLTSVFRLSGTWHISLTSKELSPLLEALPPLELKLRPDGWGHYEPQAGSTAAGKDSLVNPLWVTGQRELRWFTRVGVKQELAQVSLTGVESLQPPRGYSAFGERTTFWLRSRVMPELSAPAGPQDAFDATWNHFFQAKGYNERQKAFARAFKALSARNVAVREDDLPVLPPSTLEVAGEELVILTAGPAMSEAVPKGSPLFALPRIGAFWANFTASQARELVDFANAQRRALEQEEHDHIRAVLAQATATAQRFFASFVATQKTRPRAEALEYYLRQVLGRDIKVSQRETRAGSTADKLRYSFWLHYRRFNEDFSAEVPALFDDAGFDWDFPPFVQYEEV